MNGWLITIFRSPGKKGSTDEKVGWILYFGVGK